MFAGGIVKPLAEFVLKLVKEGRDNIPFAGVVPCAALKKCSTTFFTVVWTFFYGRHKARHCKRMVIYE